MTTKTITITLDAYNRLKQLKKDENEDFSDLIMRLPLKKRRLSEILIDYGANPELAQSVQEASDEMRSSRMREVHF